MDAKAERTGGDCCFKMIFPIHVFLPQFLVQQFWWRPDRCQIQTLGHKVNPHMVDLAGYNVLILVSEEYLWALWASSLQGKPIVYLPHLGAHRGRSGNLRLRSTSAIIRATKLEYIFIWLSDWQIYCKKQRFLMKYYFLKLAFLFINLNASILYIHGRLESNTLTL